MWHSCRAEGYGVLGNRDLIESNQKILLVPFSRKYLMGPGLLRAGVQKICKCDLRSDLISTPGIFFEFSRRHY